jgi:hypothetical protein
MCRLAEVVQRLSIGTADLGFHRLRRHATPVVRVLVLQMIDALQEYVDRHGRPSFDPSRHESGRNTKEAPQSLHATLDGGNARQDASIHKSCHTQPFFMLLSL